MKDYFKPSAILSSFNFIDMIKLKIIPPIQEADSRERRKRTNFLNMSDLYFLIALINKREKYVKRPNSTSPQVQ